MKKMFENLGKQVMGMSFTADPGKLLLALAIFYLAERIGDAIENMGESIESGAITLANNFYRIK